MVLVVSGGRYIEGLEIFASAFHSFPIQFAMSIVHSEIVLLKKSLEKATQQESVSMLFE